MSPGQRFVFEHIETGSVDLTVLQGGDQRLLVHYRATPGVNEDGGRFHFGKLRLTEQMVSLFAQGRIRQTKSASCSRVSRSQ